MKRTKLFGLMMALVVGMGFTSCSDDEDAIVTIGLTSTPPEKVNVGDLITIKYNVVSDKKLESITIKTSDNTTAEISDFTSSSSHNGTFEYKAVNEGELIIRIEAKDRDGNGDINEVKINVESLVNIYSAVLLGNNKSTTGSFYSTSTDEVFTVSEAITNSKLVDFVFFYGSNFSASIAAPSDDAAAEFSVYRLNDVDENGAPVWTTKNATKLQQITSLTEETFDAISNTDEALILATENSENWITRAVGLTEGNIVAFVTAEGKKGVFKVTNVEGAYDEESKITLEVKVQK